MSGTGGRRRPQRLGGGRQHLSLPVRSPPDRQQSSLGRGNAEPRLLDAAQRNRPRRGTRNAGYTVEGDVAGNSSNVAVSSTASTNALGHIDLWMTGPFHAIGILRPSLTQASYGQCSSPPNPSTTPWKSAGVLDVLRGQTGSWRPSGPIVFPGNGATTSRTRFIAESPDPRTYCGWSGRTVGLPLIAMMPGTATAASATLTGPNGPVPTCVLTQGNTDGVASAILGGDNAVVVVPDAPLVTGTYTASVTSNGGSAQWSFNVDPNAPLAPTQVAPTTTTASERCRGVPVGHPVPFRRLAGRPDDHPPARRPAGADPDRRHRRRPVGRDGGQRQLHRGRAVGRRLLHRLQLFSRPARGVDPQLHDAGRRWRTRPSYRSTAGHCAPSHHRHAPDHRRQRLRCAVGQVTVRPGRPQTPARHPFQRSAGRRGEAGRRRRRTVESCPSGRHRRRAERHGHRCRSRGLGPGVPV